MLSFSTPTHQFDLRAVAIVTHGDRVLLHRAEGDAYWSLPGGRVEPGEAAADAVVREMREELDVDVRAPRLALVVENFHPQGALLHHEIGLCFVVALGAEAAWLQQPGPHEGREAERRLEFRWFDRRQLRDVDVRPALLVEALAGDLAGVRHVVQRDDAARSHDDGLHEDGGEDIDEDGDEIDDPAADLPADAPVVDLDALEMAIEWVDASESYGATAFVGLADGRVVETGGDWEPEEPVPDDLDDETRWISVPDKRELDLGSPLVHEFMRERLPGQAHVVREYFRHRGAFARFKSLLDDLDRLDEWHAYEDEAMRRALVRWAAGNGLRTRREPRPAVPPPQPPRKPSKRRRK